MKHFFKKLKRPSPKVGNINDKSRQTGNHYLELSSEFGFKNFHGFWPFWRYEFFFLKFFPLKIECINQNNMKAIFPWTQTLQLVTYSKSVVITLKTNYFSASLSGWASVIKQFQEILRASRKGLLCFL